MVTNPAISMEALETAAHNIRMRVFEHTLKNNGGYLSQACSAAEMFAVLYLRLMKLGPSQAPLKPPPFQGVPGPHNPRFTRGGAYNGPLAPELDQFLFSPSHYALVLYAALIEAGRLAPDALDDFNKDGGTVEMIGAEHSPGVETTGGSLAQVISHAGGFALARKLLGESGRVWVFMSDGEFQEGQVWEAVNTMSHYKLDNVVVFVDVNGQQCDGRVIDTMHLEPLPQRLEAFGARALAVDGHDFAALIQASQPAADGRPLFVLGYTNPTRTVPLLDKLRPKLHYLRFSSKDQRAEYQAYFDELKARTGWKS